MLAFESLENIISQIKDKKISSKEVFDYFLKRIEKYDSQIEAFNFVNKDFSDKSSLELAWIPIGVKDIFAEKWIVTTWSSKMLEDFKPDYDSTVITKLNDSWMNSIWKLNMDEFAMWSSWETSAFRITKNPWDLTRIPGWSSSGSAAAVAAWLCPAALWTDTWWSIRQPASLCGIVWFKPSYGRNSRFGVFPMASSLDCPWTFTRTVKDAAILYNIMNWEDEYDNATVSWKQIIDENIFNRNDLKWVKIGVPKEYFWEWLDAWVKSEIEKTISVMRELGAEIIDISLPMTKYAVSVYYIIVPAEVSTNLARLDWIRYWHVSEKVHDNLEEFFINNRWEWLGLEAQRRSILGSYVLSAWFYDAYFTKASKVRTLIIEDFEKVFKDVDLIVWPVSPTVAYKVWEKIDDPLKMYIADAYTIPASLAWLPWMSLPCGFAKSEDSEGKSLPVWLQIIWPRLGEEKIFEVANVLEKKLDLGEKMVPNWYED